MREYIGKHTTAKCFIDLIDEEGKDRGTIQQIYEFINHEVFTNPVAIMPDTHKGNGAVIGFTMELTDKVIPNVIGVDIGCGMFTMDLGPDFLKTERRGEIDEKIRESIPFGTNVHKDVEYISDGLIKEINYRLNLFSLNYKRRYNTEYNVPTITQKWFEKKCEEIGMDYRRFLQSLGTLGGGNHFIEFGQSDNGNYMVTFHSGSRQFGLKIANYHQKKARDFKDHGQLSYLIEKEMFDYLVDMVVAQTWADDNRRKMARIFHSIFKNDCLEVIHSIHNFIDFNDWIIRKGAIRSYVGEKMIIPFNMEDGILICEGKSNAEWNFSAPHGAGRLFSRKQAKAEINIDEANNRMVEKDIYFSKLPIDETRDAYKPASIIEDNIGPTATIVNRIRPVLTMKD